MKLKTPDPARIRCAAALLPVLAASVVLAAPSLAATTAQQVGLSALIQGARDAAAIAHYRSDSGPGFVLDMTAPKPLLRFDGSAEMWALTASQGPRGDVVYTNDAGQQMLRAPRIGGMTVYPPHNTKGIAASFDQPAAPVGLVLPLNRAAFVMQTDLAADLLRHALPNLDAFDVVVDGEPPKGKEIAWAALAVDAAKVVAESIDRLSQNSANRKTLAKLTAVRIRYGSAPLVKLAKDELLIDIAPLQGIPGRPSSAKIEAALGVH